MKDGNNNNGKHGKNMSILGMKGKVKGYIYYDLAQKLRNISKYLH